MADEDEDALPTFALLRVNPSKRREPLKVRMEEQAEWWRRRLTELNAKKKRRGRPVDPATALEWREIGREVYLKIHTPPKRKAGQVTDEVMKSRRIGRTKVYNAYATVRDDPNLRAELDALIEDPAARFARLAREQLKSAQRAMAEAERVVAASPRK